MITTGQLYAYKSYIETLRKPPNNNSFLLAQRYNKETAGMLNEVRNIDNQGFAHRLALFLRGSAVDLEGLLMSDISHQDKLLINGV